MGPHDTLLDHYVRTIATERQADGARNRLLRDRFAARRQARRAALADLVRRTARPVRRPALAEQACCA